ncbi:MAG: phosphate transporter substrate-binding protein PstS family protein [Schlesneria sp.]|nr:phosphate transporter substrate-binding protein PstS family protein [Schlesneria sp.]
MHFDRTIYGFSAVAVASMLGIAAMCGGCIQSDSKVDPTATVNVEGSSTVFLISQAMANEFEKKSPCKVTVGRSGTGGGYKKFVLRQCDLWNASRPIAEKEKTELQAKGIDWLELEVGIDGISIAVHPKNDWCTELTVGQLRKIWEPDSTVNKWSDLDPKWPDQPIELYGADTDSGTFEYFTEVIVGKKNSSRTKYQAANDDNVLIQGVAGSQYALGYIPYGYCVENKDKIKVIKVSPTVDADEAAAPAVEPTVETILSGEYKPLARPLFVYANVETLKRPEIADFLKFTVSEESQPLVAKRGFVRIPDEKRKEMETRLETALKAASK